ncbi:MAG TPA: hypothetical protein VG457_04695 [Planctomycetota bacterium]|nr:hypothetical protein [Planctomycetota bacterium]
MIGLFHAFERERVRFLLVGGQAAILYGAAHFTQDLDLWIRPDPRNLRAFLRGLAQSRARVHKLTPPLTVRWARRGHGFHFIIPQRRGTPAYLDAMGRPPRVGSFDASARRSRTLKTPWGVLPVVSIEDLVDLKRTNRPGDYEAVSRLVRIRLGETQRPSSRLLSWALRNTYRLEDLQAIGATYGELARKSAAELPSALRAVLAADEASPSVLAAAGRALDAQMARDLEEGRRYWLPLIRELRTLRDRGGLWPEHLPVRAALRLDPRATNSIRDAASPQAGRRDMPGAL